MTYTRNEFGAQHGGSYAPPGQWGSPAPPSLFPNGLSNPAPQQNAPFNTFAALSALCGFLIPPAGAALGHLALAQIKRTGERGSYAAIVGLVTGYSLTVVLAVALALWASVDHSVDAVADTTTVTSTSVEESTRTVTSTAPAPERTRTKIDLNAATVGMCVEVQLRDESTATALDLYEVDCEPREGVFVVSAREGDVAGCNSMYVATPPNAAFAVCLNPFS